MRRYSSSFNGRVEGIPEISVDNFSDQCKNAYFLSHCHTDHTNGLYGNHSLSCSMKENNAKIYMTEKCMKIVKFTAPDEDICDLIQPLKLGTTTVTVKENLHIEVTLIPAGHSIGSVMFLFRVNNRTVLYTGDFRMRSNDISKYSQLHKNKEPINIDVLYIDTTFIKLMYQEFPKRSDSVDELIFKIDEWLKKNSFNRIALHQSANYAYEFVFNQIHKNLGIKVCINKNKINLWRLYSQFPEVAPAVSNDEEDPMIHLCENIRYKFNCYHNSLRENRYLSIHLSAMQWHGYNEEQKTLREGLGENSYDVCFATHCSRSEILSFVNYFLPGKVVGFPNAYEPNSPMKVFKDDYTPSPKKRKGPAPERKEKRKVDRSLLEEMFGESNL